MRSENQARDAVVIGRAGRAPRERAEPSDAGERVRVGNRAARIGLAPSIFRPGPSELSRLPKQSSFLFLCTLHAVSSASVQKSPLAPGDETPEAKYFRDSGLAI